MSPLDVADNKVADTQRASSLYVPPLQRTEGQPPPIAAAALRVPRDALHERTFGCINADFFVSHCDCLMRGDRQGGWIPAFPTEHVRRLQAHPKGGDLSVMR